MPNERHWFSLSEVLFKELEAIKGRPLLAEEPGGSKKPLREVFRDIPLRDGEGNRIQQNERKRLRWIYGAAYKWSLSALCLSGGGIRSAAFSLGIIQALADKGLLQSSTICRPYPEAATSELG